MGQTKYRRITRYISLKKMIAITNDTGYTFTQDKLSYTIVQSGETLFSGKAYKFPDSSSGTVTINKVCQNYLYQDLPDLSTISAATTYVHSGMTGIFNLVDDSGTTLGTYEFVNDWNYDSLNYAMNQNMNIPINGHYAANQFHFSTNYNKTSKKVSSVISRANNPAYCGNYALYYTNRRNGWDSFLIEGRVIEEKDSFKQFDYERSVRFADRNRKGGMVRYRNIITKEFTLNTGWLTDAQARILARHLLSSNNVYLHNLSTGEIMPCVLTDANAEYKRYLNKKELVSYEISVRCGNSEELN